MLACACELWQPARVERPTLKSPPREQLRVTWFIRSPPRSVPQASGAARPEEAGRSSGRKQVEGRDV